MEWLEARIGWPELSAEWLSLGEAIDGLATSLDMTKSEACAALIDLVRRNLELVAVGIAEINRVRDFVILEFEFDSALL